MRWEGIIKYNKEQAECDNPLYQCEKKGTLAAPLTRCSFCNITIAKRYFSKHRKRCMLTTNNPVASIPTVLLEVPLLSSYSEGFKKNVLSKFRNDSIGQLCRTDENILLVGSKFYWKMQRKKRQSI